MSMSKLKLSQEEYLKVLRSCGDDCSDNYCFYRTFLEHMHSDPRVFCQFKCIDIFKLDESRKIGHDIGLKLARTKWIEEGWAIAFAQVYDQFEYQEDLEIAKELYNRTKALIAKGLDHIEEKYKII